MSRVVANKLALPREHFMLIQSSPYPQWFLGLKIQNTKLDKKLVNLIRLLKFVNGGRKKSKGLTKIKTRTGFIKFL